MEHKIDFEKVARQHAEMDEFFTGGMTVKGQEIPQQQSEDQVMVRAQSKAEQLKEIAIKVKKCCACGLGKSRTNAVPGEGNADADIVFVGEGPGADEDAQGRPFVGRAGKLLDKIIKAMGLTRNDIFICNILKCRPPGNRDPKPDEIANCLGYLQKQLDIIEPEIIVALGSHAAKTLLDTKTPIGKLRGKIHQYNPGLDHKPVKLIATYHPAYLLRNYTRDARGKVWDDMQKVLKEVGLEIPEHSKSSSK